MRALAVHTHVSAPRERIFDYLADLANHVAFSDHYLRELRLARAKSDGLGAAVRFRFARRLSRQWAELQLTRCERPRLLALEGGMGRLGRTRLAAVYELLPAAGGVTRVEMTVWTDPGTRLDALREGLGGRRWLRRRARVALRRLRRIFEEPPRGELPRTGVAGYEPAKAPRFGAPIPPRRAPVGRRPG